LTNVYDQEHQGQPDHQAVGKSREVFMSEKQIGGPGPQDRKPAQAPDKVRPVALDLVTAKLTDVGRARPHNEDYVDFYVPPDPRQLARKGAMYVVADGMGGHQAGEVASQGAVELAIGQYYSGTTHDVGTGLVRAFRAANQQIYAQAQSDPSKGGMGTTLVAAVILGRKVYVANVGDSRAYLINRQGITQITEDHSWVEEQVRAGLLTPEQARRHPQRNLVTRALGSKPAVEVDLFEGEIGAGDALLLCSDGLTGRVEDHELAAMVQEHPPHQAAKLLVNLANERGGNDNITVLIVSAQEEPATVKAPVLPPAPAAKAARKFPLVPVLAGAAALLVLVVGGFVGAHLIGPRDRTPTPETSSLPPATETTSTAEVPTTQPSLTPTWTLTASVILSTTEPLSATEGTAPPPTSTLMPTDTAAPPTPTNTPAPPAATSGPPTATPEPDNLPAPTLEAPAPDAQLQGEQTFQWSHPRKILPLGTAFEVLIWRQGETAHNGAAEAVRTQMQTINLDNVQQILTGGAGEYYWSVRVIRKSDGTALSPEAPSRRFVYMGTGQPVGPPEEPPADQPPGEISPPDGQPVPTNTPPP
jgi:serine/threonine protein phosphatase PrpC